MPGAGVKTRQTPTPSGQSGQQHKAPGAEEHATEVMPASARVSYIPLAGPGAGLRSGPTQSCLVGGSELQQKL